MKRKETLGPHPPSKRKRRFIKDQNKENVMNKTLKPSEPIPEIEEARKSRVGLSCHLLISKPVSENILGKSIEKSIEQLQLSPSAKTEIKHKDKYRDQKVLCDEAEEIPYSKIAKTEQIEDSPYIVSQPKQPTLRELFRTLCSNENKNEPSSRTINFQIVANRHDNLFECTLRKFILCHDNS